MTLVPEESARFELRRSRRPWGPASLLFLLALALFMPSPEALSALSEDWPRLLLLLLVVLCAPALVLAVGRRHGSEAIEVLPRALRLPFGTTSVEVPLDEVEGVALEEGDRPGLFVSTSRFVVFFPQSRFSTPDAARTARDVIRERIGQLPDGQRRIAAMNELGMGAAKRPWATEGLLLAFVLVFVLAIALGDLSIERPLQVLRLGANAPVLVAAGEWWRLPASTLLHVTVVHLALIGMSLFGLGVAAERLLGGVGLAVVFLGASVAGALASAAFPDGVPYTMGASGGVFGLLGALLYVYWRFRGKIALRLQIPERTWFWMLGVNFLLPLLVPTVDGAMHLGGLVAGVLLAMLVIGDAKAVPLARANGSSLAFGGLLAVAYGVAMVAAASAHDDAPRDKQLQVMRTLSALEHPDPDFLNVVAWGVAQDPDATAEELAAAERIAERAVDVADRWAYRDTWATVVFRRGDTERAIDLELEALVDEARARKKDPEARTESTVLATQLARFLDAHYQKHGPLARAVQAPAVRARHESQRVVLETLGPVDRPLIAWVLARENGALVGLGRFPLSPQDGPATVRPRETIAWADTASLTVALFTTGEPEARAWPADARVLEYPGMLR